MRQRDNENYDLMVLKTINNVVFSLSHCLTKPLRLLRGRSFDDSLRRRWMQIESLHQVNAEMLHRLVLFSGLHSFCNHHRILVVSESNHFLDETLLDEILVDAVDE